jgi:hypothetical protein
MLEQKETANRKTNPASDEEGNAWENCKGQCGNTPWCRDCLLEKKRLYEESLNRPGCSDDK